MLARPALALALSLLAVAPALAETTPEENRRRAALVEWTAANCSTDNGVPGFVFAMSSMIINGSAPADMDAARTWVRGKIAGTFGTDTDAACKASIANFKAQTKGAAQ